MVAVWNKLVRHNLYSDNDIKFIPGIDMGEDELVSHKLFYYADKVVYLSIGFCTLRLIIILIHILFCIS